MVFPKLVDLSDRADNKDISITSEKFSIGRALQNSYIVVDIAISRFHCLLELINGVWTIQDTSSNGTLINDVLLSKDKKVLQDGDVIGFGDTLKYKFVVNPLPELSDQDIIDITDSIIDAVEEDVASAASPDVSVAEAKDAVESKIEEDDLTCSICTEMFYKAVTLTCSHTFCQFCIDQWKKTNSICPVCRTRITGECPTLVVNNLVETLLSRADEETKQRRKELILERQPVQNKNGTKNKSEVAKSTDDASTTQSSSNVESSIIDLDLSTEDEDSLESHDSDLYNSEVDMDDSYYGGYGSCYTCGERGHWSNGCPFNPRRRWH